MRTIAKQAFRPQVASIEPRVMATVGVSSALAGAAQVAEHTHAQSVQGTSTVREAAVAQAFVGVVNNTEKTIKVGFQLYPLTAKGHFLYYDIAPGRTDTRGANLVNEKGRPTPAEFAIVLPGQRDAIPVATGATESSAPIYRVYGKPGDYGLIRIK